MKNKGKLIAEVMAVCCVLSTPTFFNMHDMAASGTTTAQFKDKDNPSTLVGSNLVATITHVLQMITNNVGCIEYKIDCSKDYSTDRLNEVLTKLNLKDKTSNASISDITTIGSAVEITNVAQLFDTNELTGNKLINFTLQANKTENDASPDDLGFEETETTDANDQVSYDKTFSIYRVGEKNPTIQYDSTSHVITLKIYVNLPEKYNAAEGSTDYKPYHSFNVTATIKDSAQLTEQESTSTQSGS